MAYLVLARHGQSEWNALDKWTGKTDVGLTEQGRLEAARLATLLSDMHFDVCFTSGQIRAIETLEIIKQQLGFEAPTHKSPALNERDYGELTGLKRSDVVKQYGQEQFFKWRRGWNEPVPGGETLKDVYARAVPYFEQTIVPHLVNGQNVLLVAHGNSLRALMKYLDHISDADISKLEMLFTQVVVYRFSKAGKPSHKEVRSVAGSEATK